MPQRVIALFVRPVDMKTKMPLIVDNYGWRFEGFLENDDQAIVKAIVPAVRENGGDNVRMVDLYESPDTTELSDA